MSQNDSWDTTTLYPSTTPSLDSQVPRHHSRRRARLVGGPPVGRGPAARRGISRWPETRAQRSIRMRAPVTDLAGTPNAHRLNGYNLLKKRRIAPARRCGGCRRRTDGRVATFHTGFRRPTLPRESRASEFMPLKATKPLAKASGSNIPEDKSDQKACRRLRGGNLTSATSANVPGAVLRTTEP